MLILDFCNIKEDEWNHKTIRELNKEHSIAYTIESQQKYKTVCRSKFDVMNRTFWLTKHKDKQRQKRAQELKLRSWVFPSDKDSEKLWFYLQTAQKDYRDFLDSCAEGTLDLDFLNDALEDFSKVGFQFVRAETDTISKKKQKEARWNPIQTHKIDLRTLEDFLSFEILTHIFKHEGTIFSKVRQCQWNRCQKYFLWKRRKDQQYCSDTCSSNKRSQEMRKLHKDKINKAMRENRPGGVYVKKGKSK